MENFVSYNPTKIYFGQDCIDGIHQHITCSKALIIIGKGAVKRMGLYARIISLLNMSNLKHITYEGVRSSPDYRQADEAIKMARAYGAEIVIGIGGCSVIDVAKAVTLGFYSENPVWDFYTGAAEAPQRSLPLICILTIASTGTAMNNKSVLQDQESGIKKELEHPLLFPLVSFLDPGYTYSVPADQTAYGISIVIANALDQFFGKGSAPLAEHFCADVIKQAIEHGLKAVNNPGDYEARANIMWLATVALNGTLSAGKAGRNTTARDVAHLLNTLYDIPHGASLSVVYPAWLKLQLETCEHKLAFLAEQVFGIKLSDPNEAARAFITNLERFFDRIKTPAKSGQLNPAIDKQLIRNYLERDHTANTGGSMHLAILDNI